MTTDTEYQRSRVADALLEVATDADSDATDAVLRPLVECYDRHRSALYNEYCERMAPLEKALQDALEAEPFTPQPGDLKAVSAAYRKWYESHPAKVAFSAASKPLLETYKNDRNRLRRAHEKSLQSREVCLALLRIIEKSVRAW